MSIHDSRKIEDVKVMLIKGADGNSIGTIEKTSTSGLVDTYTITLTDGSQTTFTVTNGSSIQSITKTSTSGLTDTYTVTLTDGTETTFTVTNGKSITNIAKTSTVGLVDTYTITYNDGTTSTFTVTNGAGVEIVDNLESTDATKALSANQGHELKGQIDDAQGNFATIETTNTASQPYAVGEFLVYDGKLYEVTQAIALGDTLTVGTNIAHYTVGQQLSQIKGDLSVIGDMDVIASNNLAQNVPLSSFNGYRKIGFALTSQNQGYVLPINWINKSWMNTSGKQIYATYQSIYATATSDGVNIMVSAPNDASYYWTLFGEK